MKDTSSERVRKTSRVPRSDEDPGLEPIAQQKAPEGYRKPTGTVQITAKVSAERLQAFAPDNRDKSRIPTSGAKG